MPQRLKRFLLTMIKGIFTLSIVAAGVYGAYLSTQKSLHHSTIAEITARDNVTTQLPHSTRTAVLKSRTSAVRVLSTDESGNVAASSGTYLRINEAATYVLTTSHGIVGACHATRIQYEGDYYDCHNYVIIDEITDYVIMEVEAIEGIQPVNIERSLPRHQDWDSELSVMSRLYYTGYPNNEGPATVTGTIMNVDKRREMIFLQSYAWPGSSGSGVFSEKGNLVGVVVALDVGFTRYSLQILSNAVWVIPAYKIDWEYLYIYNNEL